MLFVLGVLIFAVGLLASIALHEIGHLVPAKRFGVKVTQYMVGFGPTIWSRKRNDTEYGVKAVPLGGYIRMIGMVPPRQDGRFRWPRRMSSAIEDFRRTSRAEVVSPEDEARQFYRLTPGKKMVVMLGGPTMNLLIYLVLTVLLLTILGQKNPTTTVSSVAKCVVAANSAQAASGTCAPNAKPTPASTVLKPGDSIVAIDGKAIRNWDQAVKVIEASPNKTLSMTLKRDGALKTVTITPVENVKYANDTGTKTKRAGYIGVSTTDTYQPVPITQVPGQIGSQINLGVQAIGNYPSKIHSLWQTVFDGKKRDPNGAIGVVGIGRLGGEVADSHSLDLQDKIYVLVALLASVNLLLFFFNLLPLLPLDGGHVAGAMYEAAKRGIGRLRRKPWRGYVDTAQMLPVMYGVASVLIFLTLLVVYADIVKPVTLNG